MEARLSLTVTGILLEKGANMQNYYTLEYSVEQGAFHHDDIASMISSNLEQCTERYPKNTRPDYLCLGIFDSTEDRKQAQEEIVGYWALRGISRWLSRRDAAAELKAWDKSDDMTEKELLEIKIKHLQDRKKLMTSEIDLKLRLLEEALALQKGFEVSGKYSFRFEQF